MGHTLDPAWQLGQQTLAAQPFSKHHGLYHHGQVGHAAGVLVVFNQNALGGSGDTADGKGGDVELLPSLKIIT